MTKKIYFDEAGNTGADLLNEDQKTFILCSTSFNEKEAKILADLFNTNTEIHFKKLKTYRKGQKSIVELLNHNLLSEGKIHLFAVHKEYAVVALIIHHLVETFYYHLNHDIYKTNEHLWFVNKIYFFGNYDWNKELYRKMLNCFVEMFRERTTISIINFYHIVEELYYSLNEDDKHLIGPILGSKRHIREILSVANKYTLDVTLSGFYSACDFWYKSFNEKFDVVCDDSKQLDYYTEIIEFTKNLDIPIQEVGYGKRKMTFPLQINDLTLKNSSKEVNIQISDIIASSLAFMYNNKNVKYQSFIEEIKNSKILELGITSPLFPMRPEEITEGIVEGTNILDFLAEQRVFEERKKKPL